MNFILSGFRWAIPALLGYFVNDIGDGAAKVLPDSGKDFASKNPKAYSAIILIVVGAVAAFIMSKVFKGKMGKMFGWAAGAAWAADLLTGGQILGGDGAVMATALVTLTTGVGIVTSVNLAFLPERLSWTASTQLSGVKITVQGDGVTCDLDANGLSQVGVNRLIGQVTNGYTLTLANSLFKAKNVLFEFTNSAAQTPVIYYDSDSTASGSPGDQPLFLQSAKLPILVGGNDVSNFATLSLPSLAATDTITITYRDGTTQSGITRNDLQYKLGFTQNVVNTPVYMIDNFSQTIKSVTIVAGSSQTAYMQRWAPSVQGASVAGQILA